MADWLKEQQADAAILSALDSVAWTFNVRGQDVDHTPVALSFAIVNDDGTADLFVASEKLGDDVRQHLGNGVKVHERDAFEPHLRSLAGKTVIADPERAVAAIFEALEGAGAKVVQKRDPSVLPRAIKNEAEVAGHHSAQARDGAALTKFLHWLSVEAPKGGIDELGAAAKLEEFRKQGGTCATPASTPSRARVRTARSSIIG
jgi:Xaa-Pro aminopeptidase